MSYRIYQTEGIILDMHARGEAGYMLAIFSPPFGKVYAVAGGVRKGAAKLAPATQRFCVSDFALVRGREVWRVTGAIAQYNAYYALDGRPDAQCVLARFINLANRLIVGESPQQSCYAVLRESIGFLIRTPLSDERLATLECLTVLRMLRALGYVGAQVSLTDALDEVHVTDEALEAVAPLRRDMVRTINDSLSASHL